MLGLFILTVCRGEGTSAGVRLPALAATWAGLSLRRGVCHLSLWHTGQLCIYCQYLLYTETLMDGKSVSPGRLFCICVRSLQSPIFLAILLIGIMMLSESWCFEQKVQEKDGMERERNQSFPWSNFCMMKQDMMVVSFNWMRCAGGFICAVYGLCCCTSSRQLG